MPDDVLLVNIKLRKAFFDKKSTERGTSRTKAKYKLLTRKSVLEYLDLYLFHILTLTEESYIKEKTINIYYTDWEYIEKPHLYANYSKLCTQVIDVINRSDLLKKIRDNNFLYAGLLKQEKFTDILQFIERDFEKVTPRTDFDVKEIIEAMINNKSIGEPVLKKFNLL